MCHKIGDVKKGIWQNWILLFMKIVNNLHKNSSKQLFVVKSIKSLAQ